MTKKTLTLVLEVLEELNNTNSHWWQEVDRATIDKIDPAITAVKEDLVQLEQQEYKKSNRMPGQRVVLTKAGEARVAVGSGAAPTWAQREGEDE